MRSWHVAAVLALLGVDGCLVPGLEVGDGGQLSSSGSSTSGAGSDNSNSGGASGKGTGSAGSNNRSGESSGGSATTAGRDGDGGSGDTAAGGEPPEAGANAGGSTNGGTGGVGGNGTGGKAGAGGSGGKGGTSTGGSGGTGGAGQANPCAEHPLTVKTTWAATASGSSLGNGLETDSLYNPPSHMTDGSLTERWSSGKAQAGDEWIQIDFGATVVLSSITLKSGVETGDFPTAYAVRLSSSSNDFNAAIISSGPGTTGDTVVNFPQHKLGRYLTVRQTGVGQGTGWWSVAEVLATCAD